MRLLISEAEIVERVEEVAATLNTRGSPIAFVVILKGAICLIADLMRHLAIPFELYFISASSYGMRGTEPGKVTVSRISDFHIEGKEVIVVDDICDTGATLFQVLRAIDPLQPKSVSTLVLLNKLISSPRDIEPDMALFDIEDLFVIGYGLDYKEHYRGLQGIYTLEKHELRGYTIEKPHIV